MPSPHDGQFPKLRASFKAVRMSDLIRDSAFGRLVRSASGNKYFTYAKERDPSLWKKYVHEDDGHTYNIARGVRVDPEKGKGIHVEDWYGPDDPDASNDI